MNILRGMFLVFWDLYLFSEPPNNHCFDRVVQGQLSKCSKRNTATAVRTLAKFDEARPTTCRIICQKLLLLKTVLKVLQI